MDTAAKPGRADRPPPSRTYERYEELLTNYVLPTLGHIAIQKIGPTALDHLYIALERRLSVTTVRHVHTALKACLATAVRKGHLAKNPADNADPPRAKREEIGEALTTDEVTRLLTGMRPTAYYPIVATAVMTGVRLSELLALRWGDVDFKAGTVSITRAIEQTRKHGLVVKEPKSWRGKRTEALIFPVSTPRGGTISFTALRNPRGLTKEIRGWFRNLGFTKLRFHDLRGTHSTALLDAGVPVHTVAKRLGNSPEVLLKRYAKRTRTADERTAVVLSTLAKSLQGSSPGRACG